MSDADEILKALGLVEQRAKDARNALTVEGDPHGCQQCRIVMFGLFQEVLGNVSNINKRLDTLEKAFIRTHEGLDVDGHRLYHQTVVKSRTTWMDTLHQLREWGIKGIIGAIAVGICTLAVEWLRRKS